MQQLSALDSAWINLETGTTHLHGSYLAVYDQSTAPDQPIRFKDIIQNLKNRLHKLPELRQRYVPVPLGLDYPYWIADPEFDIEFHVRHIALPAPGDWRQLCIQAARLHSRPLDMNHAPWEIYIIEGLNNVEGVPEGSFAMVVKLHHSLFDGQAIGRLIQAMHDTMPTPPAVQDVEPLVVDRVPTAAELLLKASLNRTKHLYKAGQIVAKYSLPIAKSALTQATIGKLKGKKKPSKTAPPRTRFNGKISPHRVFDGLEFDIAEVQAMRKLLPGVTINDIAMTVVAGGLRRYLDDKLELPAQSIRNCMPVNVAGHGKHEGSNKISFAFTDLHTEIADVKERLVAIHASSAQAKVKDKKNGGKMLMDVSSLMPSTISSVVANTLLSKESVVNKLPILGSSVITNVQGPQCPIYYNGAKLVRFQGMGIPTDLAGLFHTVFSYNGTMGLSFVSCREMMPDPAFYKECLEASYQELKAAILVEPAEKNVAESAVEPVMEVVVEQVVEKVPAKAAKPAEVATKQPAVKKSSEDAKQQALSA